MTTGLVHIFDADRLTAFSGGADGGTVYFYYTGTTTLAPIYSNLSLTVAMTNPIVIPVGGILPNVYLDPSITYRRRTIHLQDGSIKDVDPYFQITGNTLYSNDGSGGTKWDTVDEGLQYVSKALPINIDSLGADGTQTGDSAAIKAALTLSSTTGAPILLPARRIYWDGTAIVQDKVRIWGSGCPVVNSTQTGLVGGTIIEGSISVTGTYVDYRDFGVDLISAADTDGIKAKPSSLNSGTHLHIENLIALCNNRTTSNAHSLLFEGFQKVTGGNVFGYKGRFGVVIKCQNFNLSVVGGINNRETSVYLKSDNTNGMCSYGSIGTVITDGGADRNDFGLRFQSDSAIMRNIRIGTLHAARHYRSACPQALPNAGVSLENIHIDSIISEYSGYSDWSVLNLAPTVTINNIGYGTLISKYPGTSSEVSPKTVEIVCQPGAYISTPYGGRTIVTWANGTTQAKMDGTGFIGSNVKSCVFGEITVVEENGSKIGGFLFSNDPAENSVGPRRCKLTGSGRPQPGRTAQVLSGSTNTLLVPDNASGLDKAFIKVTHTGAASITSIAPLLTGTEFNDGFEITILNNSSDTLTVKHGSNILGIGYADKTVTENNFVILKAVPGGAWVIQ